MVSPISAKPGEARIEPVVAFDTEERSIVAWSRSLAPAAAA
jgi:hypothetical protein